MAEARLRRGIVKARPNFAQAWLVLPPRQAHIGAMGNEPRQPEIEIIPPGQPEPRKPRWAQNRERPQDDARVFMWSNEPGAAPFRYGRPGPLGIFLIFLGLAAFSAVGFLVFLGIAALALPLLGALVLGVVLAGILRRL
jgi:hypothetical protein